MVSRRTNSDQLHGTLDMLVLKSLQRGASHGYAIAVFLQSVSQDVLQVEEGSLYPALQRMLKEGWVTAAWRESAAGRRIRVYRITAAGARHLDDHVSHFEQMLEGVRLVLKPAAR